MIEYGYCHCGCGQKTKIAWRNWKAIGWIKGEPVKYLANHNMSKKQNYFCKYCGIKYEGMGNNSIYCSLKCRQKAYDIKRKDKRIKRGRLSTVKLTDGYIRGILCNNSILNAEDIPKEFIIFYKKYLAMKRILYKSTLKGAQYVECNRNIGSIINANQGA